MDSSIDVDKNELSENVSVKVLKSNRSYYEASLVHKFPHKFYPFISTVLQKPNNNYQTPFLSNLKLDKCDLKFSLPYPIHFAKKICVKSDPCWKFVKDKDAYNKRISFCRGQFEKHHKKTITTSVVKKRKCIELPKYLVELASESVKDPDPYFDGSYDYYYTGGNISKIKIVGEVFIAALSLDNNLSLINEENEKFYNLKNLNNEKIYGINGYKDKILLRQKLHLSCYNFDEDNLKLLYEIKSEDVPFICSRLSKKQQLGYLDVYSNLKIENIETQQKILEHKFYCDDESAHLSQFAFRKHDIIFTNSNSLEILDRRSMDLRSYLVNRGFFYCNNIYSFCFDGHFVYILTKHNVVMFDVRQMLVLKKWTHFLSLPPISIKKEGDNLIIQSFAEVICLSLSDEINCLPLKIPLVKETFDKRNLHHNPVLNLDINTRFDLSITGVEIHGDKLFMGNSVGDIFVTEFGKINKKHTSEDISINKLNKMIDEINTVSETLIVTSYKNSADFKTVMTSETKPSNLRKMLKSSNKKVHKLLDLFPDLEKYEMAKVWADDKVPFNGDDSDGDENKVSNWLKSETNFKDNDGDIFD